MKSTLNNMITDEEMQLILENALKEFQKSIEQIDMQQNKIINYLLSKNFKEPVNVLKKNLEILRKKLVLNIESYFPNKDLDCLDIFTFLENNSINQINKEYFFQGVISSYQEYIYMANSLLIDLVSDLKVYFPDDFIIEYRAKALKKEK